MKTYFFSLIFVLSFFSTFAQIPVDPVIMKINGQEMKKSEFDYIYSKNNNEEVIDKKTLDEYVDLFKNFKLKVMEAEAQGLDTTASFTSELSEYRAQLAKPYYVQLETDAKLVEKEYERTKDLVEISHILLTYPDMNNRATVARIYPKDTLELYNKAMQIYNRLKKGEDFGKLVKEASDDSQTKENEIPGYLGWFTGIVLHPDLEDAVFSTPVGKFSTPVRANYGYHIVKVLNRKPNPGQINVAHILITCAKDADVVQIDDATKKINDLYQKVLGGADFAELAKENSQDPGSAEHGGEIGWFGYGAMVKEFQDAAFNLKEIGDVSKPVRSSFGFHIIKLLGKKPVASFEEQKAGIESKYANGGFFLEVNKPGIEKLKADFGFQKKEEAYQKLQREANSLYPTEDEFTEKYKNDPTVLFTVGGKDYTIADFIAYMAKNKRTFYLLSTEILADKLNYFEYDMAREAEDASLESRFPEFRNLMKEYRDGILMFDISSNEVWNKASEDTVGLNRFFEANKEKYKWDEPHFKGYVIHVKDAKTKKQMQKEISKMTPDEAASYLLENYKVGDVSYVKAEKGLFKKGENAFVDEAVFKTGKATKLEGYEDFFVLGKATEIPQSYVDARGPVITDYQDYLEKEWLNKLNEKYSVEIFRDVLLP